MNNNKKVAVTLGLAAGAFMLSGGMSVDAAPVAGASAIPVPTTDVVNTNAQAGANAALSNIAATAQKDAEKTVAKEAEEAKKNANVAIANVNDYVNVRKAASEDAEVVGKLYNNNYSTVLEQDGNWVKIKSGKLEGFVCADFLKVGDVEAIKAAATQTATVKASTLYVRSETSKDAEVLSLAPSGDELTVTNADVNEDGWVEVSTNDGNGYVAADYVEVKTSYSYGETLEEEQARIAAAEAENAAQEAQDVADNAEETEEAEQTVTEQATAPETEEAAETATSGGGTGSAVSNYAAQFLGNPYVYGGTSLTHGIDCSGFVMKVYEHFGVSLPHSSSADRNVGVAVSVKDMQPGDIVCYSGHVGIYAGNGKLINASNRRTGIKYSNVHYRPIVAVRRIFQ